MKIKNIVLGAICLGVSSFATAGAGWDVPDCDAPAVTEAYRDIIGLRNVNFKGLGRHAKFKNAETIKMHTKKFRTCVVEVYDGRTDKYIGDYYYLITVTHGIKWVVGPIE